MRYGLLGASAAIAVAGSASAQISLTGATYSENFNQLASSGSPATPFSATVGVQASLPLMTNPWQGTKVAGTSTVAMPYTVSDGAGTSGGVYTLGVASNADRALGMLASGSNTAAIGACFTNNTGSTISSLTITFNQERYRTANGATGVQNTFPFTYGTTATVPAATFANYLTVAGFSADTNGDLIGAYIDPVVFGAPPVSTAKSVTITTTVLVGENIYIRWTDTNDAGSDATVGVDDFQIDLTLIPTPGSLALLGLGGLAGLRRRRA